MIKLSLVARISCSRICECTQLQWSRVMNLERKFTDLWHGVASLRKKLLFTKLGFGGGNGASMLLLFYLCSPGLLGYQFDACLFL